MSRLDHGFVAQPRNRPQLHLAVLATMRPALDPTGHRVPRTKPTCLLHTWRPYRQRPCALVLHLHQHESSGNLHLQYLAKTTQHCQSLITPGSDHPPVLEPHMVLKCDVCCAAFMRRSSWCTRCNRRYYSQRRITPSSKRCKSRQRCSHRARC
jgi:hypothetical protein